MGRKRRSECEQGFTLIELLVVISVVALLMAILMPGLQRAKRQARAVVCQTHLRQWGAILATYVNENHGRLPEPPTANQNDPRFQEWQTWAYGWGGGWGWGRDLRVYDRAKDIRYCPMATKPANPMGIPGQGRGGTFLAWGPFWTKGQEPVAGWNPYGSYGANMCVTVYWLYSDEEVRKIWRTADVAGADKVPAYFDHISYGVWSWKGLWDDGGVEPPPCDAIPTGGELGQYMTPCINRHDGGINAAFLDWSVRKVGLKELWTLKWNRDFKTSGTWTKAGGVQPEDWPAWMRKFKDY